jgi:hypothetical protein
MTEPTYDDLLSDEQVNAMLALKELNANDRCDRCGAQAYVLIAVNNGSTHLLFCAHHWDKVKTNDSLVMVRDDRSRLLARNEPAFTGV